MPNIETIIETAENVSDNPITRRNFLKWAGAAVIGSLLPSSEAEASKRPDELVGTTASLERQVRQFSIDNLAMLKEEDLKPGSSYRTSKILIEIARETPNYYIDNDRGNAAITSPYVNLFLQRLSEQFHDKFNGRLKVTSLTRSSEYQHDLRYGNRKKRIKRSKNAVEPEKSPHVRGAGIDISYVPMNSKQRRWMRSTLVSLEKAGYIEATEEVKEATFHIMVFKNYVDFVRKKLKMNPEDFTKYYERTTGGIIY